MESVPSVTAAPDHLQDFSSDLTPLTVARLMRHAQGLGLDTEGLEDLLIPARGHEGEGGDDASLWEMEARALIQAGAPFAAVSPWLWRMFHRSPGAELAARIAEYAWFKGTAREQEATLTTLLDVPVRFYHLMAPGVRTGFAVAAFATAPDAAGTLLQQLAGERDFTPLERLLQVLVELHAAQSGECYAIYCRYQPLVEGAAASAPDALAGHLPGMYYALALAALDDYDAKRASQLLARMPAEGMWQEKAAALAGKLADVSGISEEIACLREAMDAPVNEKRLALLTRFITLVESRQQDYGHSRLVILNDHLVRALAETPADPAMTSALSHLLAAHLSLHGALPGITGFFLKKAGDFADRHQETALWTRLAAYRGQEPLVKYCAGVAGLHLALAADTVAEEALCLQFDLIEKYRPSPEAPGYRDMIGAFLTAAAARGENTDSLQSAKLMVPAGLQFVSEQWRHELMAAEQRSGRFLARLLRALPSGDAGRRERRLLWSANPLVLRRSNADLEELWQGACGRGDFDLAWRAASVALARNALHPMVFQVWSLFGEKRPLGVSWSGLDLPKALRTLEHKPPVFRQMVEDLVSLRLFITKVAKHHGFEASGNEQLWRFPAVRNALDAVSWLVPERSPAPDPEAGDGVGAIDERTLPALPGRVFSITAAHLAERLGWSVFGWDMARMLQTLLPYAREIPAGVTVFPDRSLAPWCPPAQRTALARIVALFGQVSSQEIKEVLLTFVTRLALIVGGDHFNALADMQKMGTDLRIINQLENWILSDTYGQIRKEVRMTNRHLVPAALRSHSLLSPSPRSY